MFAGSSQPIGGLVGAENRRCHSICSVLATSQGGWCGVVFMTRRPLLRLVREWTDLPAEAVLEQPEATVQSDQRQRIPC